MSIKRELKNSSRYKNVFVENDIPPGQRKLNSNLRTIVNTIGRDRLHFRGSRILPTETGQNTGSSHDTPDHSYNSRRRADENRPYRYDGGSARDDYNSRDSYRRHHNNYRTDRLREILIKDMIAHTEAAWAIGAEADMTLDARDSGSADFGTLWDGHIIRKTTVLN